MQITNDKIEVTHQMMENEGMIRDSQFGIPVDNNGGLKWKDLIDLQDSDFDKIEEYFLSK